MLISDQSSESITAAPVSGSSGFRRSRIGDMLNRMTVRNRLLVLVGVFAVGWFVTLGVATWGLTSGRSSAGKANASFSVFELDQRAYEGWLTQDDQTNMTAALGSLHALSELPLLNATIAQTRTGHAQAVTALTALARSAPTAAQRSAAEKLLTDLEAFDGFSRRVVSAVRTGHLREAAVLASITNAKVSDQTQADFDALGASIAKRAHSIQPQMDRKNTIAMIALMVSTLAFGLACQVFVRRIIMTIAKPLERITIALEKVSKGNISTRAAVRPGDEFGRVAEMLNIALSHEEAALAREEELRAKVEELLSVVNAAAAGDLTVEVPDAGDDAIGRVGAGLAEFLADLRGRIVTIGDNADTMSDASARLTATAERLSSAAAETSEQATAVTGHSSEVSDHVHSAAGGAEQLTVSIRDIAANASEATRIASEAVTVAGQAGETVEQLARSSTEIGEVTKVISGIARQTNLLALNASIEAARSGEAGRGFAVVAEEVRVLAEDTAAAILGIDEKISSIQNDSDSARAAIGHIGEIIASIDSLQSAIATAVAKQSVTTEEIVRTVVEAADGTVGITDTIGGVARSAQSASGGALETEHAAQDLARTAADLQQLVARFVV